jgi:hypothetical protein
VVIQVGTILTQAGTMATRAGIMVIQAGTMAILVGTAIPGGTMATPVGIMAILVGTTVIRVGLVPEAHIIGVIDQSGGPGVILGIDPAVSQSFFDTCSSPLSPLKKSILTTSDIGGPAPWGDRPWGGIPWATTTVIGVIPTAPVWWNGDPNPGVWVNPLPPRTIYTTWNPPVWNPPVYTNWDPAYTTWDPAYTSWDSAYYPTYTPPWANLPPPYIPPVTVTVDLPALPSYGCNYVPVTYPSNIITTATYTDSITQPPPDAMITIYVDPNNGQTSTDWGPVETVYEVYVYETTATVDMVSTTTQCGTTWY